jgi:hypothetical protein
LCKRGFGWLTERYAATLLCVTLWVPPPHNLCWTYLPAQATRVSVSEGRRGSSSASTWNDMSKGGLCVTFTNLSLPSPSSSLSPCRRSSTSAARICMWNTRGHTNMPQAAKTDRLTIGGTHGCKGGLCALPLCCSSSISSCRRRTPLALHVSACLGYGGGEKMLHVDTFATHQWHCLLGWYWLKPQGGENPDPHRWCKTTYTG